MDRSEKPEVAPILSPFTNSLLPAMSQPNWDNDRATVLRQLHACAAGSRWMTLQVQEVFKKTCPAKENIDYQVVSKVGGNKDLHIPVKSVVFYIHFDCMFSCILIMSIHTKISSFSSFHWSCQDEPAGGQTHQTFEIPKAGQTVTGDQLMPSWTTWIDISPSWNFTWGHSRCFRSLTLLKQQSCAEIFSTSCLCFTTCSVWL